MTANTTNTTITPGMTIAIGKKLFRIESSVKVTATKGEPFIKTKLRNLANEEIVEKNFKPGQEVKEVTVSERNLEYLYLEGKEYLFLDIDELGTVSVPATVIKERIQFLKEGTQVVATMYGETVFSLELPPYLELMVASIEISEKGAAGVAEVTRTALLETGARVEVPPFVESGDILKVDTRTGEYIQRV